MHGYKSFLRLGSFDDPNIFSLQKDGYELMSFTNHFHQDIDEKGKVLSEVKGGTISILIDGFPSQELVDWGVESKTYHSGEIIVLDSDNNIMEKIQFEQGACTLFKIHYKNVGKAYCATKLVIESRNIKAGVNVELNRRWTID